MVDGWALALASLMLTSGTAGDRYGHRRVVPAGLAGFGAGSPACGLAPDVAVLVAARVAQGVGAALLLPGTLAIIGRAFREPAARPGDRGVGGHREPGAAGRAAARWRADGGARLAGRLLLVDVPIVLLALAWSAAVVTESVDERAPRLDLPGMVFGGLALPAVTYAFIEHARPAEAVTATLLAVAALVAPAVAGHRLVVFLGSRWRGVGEGRAVSLSVWGRAAPPP
ncbi:MFS transporter [Streptomyces sp. NPDC013157]|uniref:MFS transporter n=1 Tax=Streptomyces sp. NPDC013157 TaxID=3364861 RepID=UPI0036C25C1E